MAKVDVGWDVLTLIGTAATVHVFKGGFYVEGRREEGSGAGAKMAFGAR